MKNVILARYGEIHLKGNNRYIFEDALEHNIAKAVKGLAKVKKIGGRYLISDYDIELESTAISKLQKVFGLISVSPAVEIETSEENITNFCKNIQLKDTFKVKTTRADKHFPIHSNDLSMQMGDVILDNNTDLRVDLHNPKHLVEIDIRENGRTYILSKRYDGIGGLPVGTSGLGMLMLSGGIDSPVAGYLMAKRGLNINAVYFHSFPYTSEQAKQKVVDLAKILTEYTGKINLYIVPFTKIQEEINANCDRSFMITIMRRIMVRITERLAKSCGAECIVTGENLAQVASQTVQGITCSNSVAEKLPILRPLIAYDKIEITRIAERIGTFETSSLPYEDCCTVFVPPKPVIKPKVSEAIKQENRLVNMDELIDWAVANTEVKELGE